MLPSPRPSGLLRILLVEDDLVDAAFIRHTLDAVAPTEFDLHHVGSLGEAYAALAEFDIAVILLDLSLPDSHGLETFTRCQALAGGIPIVVLSGVIDPPLKEGSAISQGILAKNQIDGARLQRTLRRALRRQMMEQSLFHIATHDPLTGLANRLLFGDRLLRAIGRTRRSRVGGALFLLDLDGFKPVNDALGHSTGDRVLTVIAERLTGGLRETDCVARLGGDEFAIVLEDIGERTLLARKAAELLVRIAQPMLFDGTLVRVWASLGVARFPNDGLEPQELIDRADDAMYAAKTCGGGVVRFTSPLHEVAGSVTSLTGELPPAFLIDQLTSDPHHHLPGGA